MPSSPIRIAKAAEEPRFSLWKCPLMNMTTAMAIKYVSANRNPKLEDLKQHSASSIYPQINESLLEYQAYPFWCTPSGRNPPSICMNTTQNTTHPCDNQLPSGNYPELSTSGTCHCTPPIVEANRLISRSNRDCAAVAQEDLVHFRKFLLFVPNSPPPLPQIHCDQVR